uniref:C-type lectin and Fibrinogen domain containing protein n=1 Tax=Haemonchus contortus TaxID=6289 RepID=W6NX35_HAECO
MQRLLLLLLGYLTIAVVSGTTCNQLNSRGHCIHKGPDKRSWERAEAYCESRGGHLTSIHNKEDIAAIGGTWGTTDCMKEKCFVCETSKVMSDCEDWYKAGYRERVNGSDSFWDHSWSEYKHGFGKIGKNTTFWLGNEALHQLTYKDPNVTLRVEMRGDRTPNAQNPSGYWWNHYFKFRVGSEETNYTLERLYINWKNIQGNASIARNDMTYSVGARFSTVDRINDPKPECITQHKMGGWWLRNCAQATLNGAYDITQQSTDGYNDGERYFQSF